ncbi:hypothetical protein LMJ53_01965 [Rheinheimera sp. UJ51]|uniref:hypothetical protein n=1 Tax=Rheinheimera sp. UJ51 TaxID=2892446 RepID=UPI001E29D29D|nr:hypothetical protein [Rheinheimera sp. UJ51]MCC5450498.1 hypothetical protein [Rheinheimera sp. UJ51]
MLSSKDYLEELTNLKQALLADIANTNSELDVATKLFEQLSFAEVSDGLSEEQRKIVLNLQQDWLVDIIALLQSERENIVKALENIQLAKKGKASYHTVQNG